MRTQGQGFSSVLNSNLRFCSCHSLQQEYTKRAHVSHLWQWCSSLCLAGQRFLIWNEVCVWDGWPSAQTQGVLPSLWNRTPALATLCLTLYRLRPPFQPRFCISFVNARADWEPWTLEARSKLSSCSWIPFAVRQQQNHWGSCSSKEELKSVKVLSSHIKARTQSFPTELRWLQCWRVFKIQPVFCGLWESIFLVVSRATR